MLVFCDRLTVSAACLICLRRLRGALPAARVLTLDGPPAGIAGRLASRLVRAAGLSVEEAPFFAGHLRTADGEGVGPAAAKRAFWLADTGGRALVRDGTFLARLNGRYPREIVRLRLAKQLWLPGLALWMRILVADALARQAGESGLLIVRWPAMYPRELISELGAPLPVVRIGRLRPGWKTGRLSAVLWAMRQVVRRVAARRPPHASAGEDPSLLLLQEDDLSFDRSLRSQPHWLDPAAPPPFRVVVLRSGRTADNLMTPEQQKAGRVEPVEIDELATARGDAPIVTRTGRDGWALCFGSIAASRFADAWASGEAARLLLEARDLARLCVERGVTAFLTCENYMLHADAMQVIGRDLGIRTLSYQYSNMTYPSLPMVATADELFTFSPMFQSRFTWPGFTPPAFREVGYVFASNFQAVRPRALERRRALQQAGARFVIGFFDESVQRDKYGWISPDDYERELLPLVELVLNDPSVGLVVKTQFHHNLNGARGRLLAALDAGRQLGRIVLPTEGRHRNSILPCDVAASCDITIGHVFGGSASLEAALAGCRSVMLNSQAVFSLAHPLYARAPIVFGSMPELLDALTAFRAGDPAYQALGDWSGILPEFDAFRDERTSERFRSAIEAAVLSRRPKCSAVGR